MPNTLTGLLPTLYQAVDVVSRELVGFIPAVTIDSSAARAALNQSIDSPVTRAAWSSDVIPAVTPPDDGDQIIDSRSLTITKSRRVPVSWNGEQSLAINNGPGVENVVRNQFAQAMRTLCNEVEADLAALYATASLAYGAPGVTPFAADLSDSANVLKLLLDNGAQTTDLQLIINTTAGAKIRTLDQMNDVSAAGDDSLLRQGILGDIHGLAIRESAQIKSTTKGTGVSYGAIHSLGTYLPGETIIEVDFGTGTILAGDIVTFLGDPNKYVVASALSGNTFTLAEPGLRQFLPDLTDITIGSSYTANMGFNRSAIVLATRTPALPDQGDMAEDRTIITDPHSGLAFEVSVYRMYRKIQYEVSLAWGVANMKPESTVILQG